MMGVLSRAVLVLGVACVAPAPPTAPTPDAQVLARSVSGEWVERVDTATVHGSGCVGDFNGDGFDDVVQVRPASRFDKTVTLFVNEGSFRFPTPAKQIDAKIPEPDRSYAGCRVPGDLDGDGFDDLFMIEEGVLRVYWGSPGGLSNNWGLQRPGDGKSMAGAALPATVGDLDGDGLDDFLMLTKDEILIFDGMDRGLADVPTSAPIPATDYVYEVINYYALADTDGDGIREIYVGGAFYSLTKSEWMSGYLQYEGVLGLGISYDPRTRKWENKAEYGTYYWDSEVDDMYSTRIAGMWPVSGFPTAGDEAIILSEAELRGHETSFQRCTLAGCVEVYVDADSRVQDVAVGDLDRDGASEVLLSIEYPNPRIIALEDWPPSKTEFPNSSRYPRLGGPGNFRGTGYMDTVLTGWWNTVAWLEGEDEPDQDSDGLYDYNDNCPKLSNPDQQDSDGDRFGDVCDQCQGDDLTGDADDDGFCLDLDCDDGDAWSYPGAAERCDGVDNDCDGALTPQESDADKDGYVACTPTDWRGEPSEGGDDCDDQDASIHPGAEEVCDGLDSDCTDGPGVEEFDADEDGYVACVIDGSGWNGDARVQGGGDCGPLDPTVYPGGIELCDGLDNDCDGAPRADEVDADGDGYAVCDVDEQGWDAGGGIVGGGDCDDGDPEGWPGSNTYDLDCQPKACGGCSASGALSWPGAVLVVGLLGAAGRRRYASPPESAE